MPAWPGHPARRTTSRTGHSLPPEAIRRWPAPPQLAPAGPASRTAGTSTGAYPRKPVLLGQPAAEFASPLLRVVTSWRAMNGFSSMPGSRRAWRC